MWLGGVNDVMHRKRGLRFEKKSVSWVPASEEESWLSELAEALRWVPHVVWGRWKSRHRKIVPLSSSSYLPTPLLGQDMTQGQFFKRSLTGLNSEFSFS